MINCIMEINSYFITEWQNGITRVCGLLRSNSSNIIIIIVLIDIISLLSLYSILEMYLQHYYQTFITRHENKLNVLCASLKIN